MKAEAFDPNPQYDFSDLSQLEVTWGVEALPTSPQAITPSYEIQCSTNLRDWKLSPEFQPKLEASLGRICQWM